MMQLMIVESLGELTPTGTHYKDVAAWLRDMRQHPENFTPLTEYTLHEAKPVHFLESKITFEVKEA